MLALFEGTAWKVRMAVEELEEMLARWQSRTAVEELKEMLAGFASGRISYEDMKIYLGHGVEPERLKECKATRKSGIRLNRKEPRYIQIKESKRKPGRPKDSETCAERNLTIILIVISLSDEWTVNKRGRVADVQKRVSEKVGRNITGRSIRRIVKEWNEFKGSAVYDEDDASALLQWFALVEEFKGEYMKRHSISNYNPLKIK